jgi:hypothetical protein
MAEQASSDSLRQNALFQGQDIRQSAWVGSQLDGSQISNSTLTDVSVLNSSLDRSTFVRVSLSGSRIVDSDLSNVVIEHSRIESLVINGVDVTAFVEEQSRRAQSDDRAMADDDESSADGTAQYDDDEAASPRLFIGDDLKLDVVRRLGLEPIGIEEAIRRAALLSELAAGEGKSDGKENSSDGTETGKETKEGEETGKEASDPEIGGFDRIIYLGQPSVVERYLKPIL